MARGPYLLIPPPLLARFMFRPIADARLAALPLLVVLYAEPAVARLYDGDVSEAPEAVRR